MIHRDDADARAGLARGARGRAPALIDAARAEAMADRQLRIGPADRRGEADVAILVDRTGVSTAAHVVRGATELAPLAAKAVGRRVRLAIPPGPVIKVVRRAKMSCGPDAGCILVLPTNQER